MILENARYLWCPKTNRGSSKQAITYHEKNDPYFNNVFKDEVMTRQIVMMIIFYT